MTLTRRLKLYSEEGVTASFTSEEFQIISRSKARSFMGRLKAINNAGSTPTLDVVIQARAPDDESEAAWVNFVEFDQMTTESDGVPKQVHPVNIAVMPHFIFRAKGTIAGTNPDYDVMVDLWYGPT